VNAIHATVVDASQVQSRVVVTVKVPVPPAAGAVLSDGSAVTWHLVDDGALTETSDELQLAAITANANAISRRDDVLPRRARICCERREGNFRRSAESITIRPDRRCNSVAYAAQWRRRPRG
jgi:hypothetical protein